MTFSSSPKKLFSKFLKFHFFFIFVCVYYSLCPLIYLFDNLEFGTSVYNLWCIFVNSLLSNFACSHSISFFTILNYFQFDVIVIIETKTNYQIRKNQLFDDAKTEFFYGHFFVFFPSTKSHRKMSLESKLWIGIFGCSRAL